MDEDFLGIVSDHKRCVSFNINGGNEESGVLQTLIPPRNGLMIVDLYVKNNAESKSDLEVFVTSDEIDREITLAVVSPGECFNMVDVTGLRFWKGSQLMCRSKDNVVAIIFVGFLRTVGIDYSIWNYENIPLDEKLGHKIITDSTIYERRGRWQI